MRASLLAGATFCAAIAFAQPVLANDGVRIGNNNTINQDGRVNGAMTATAIGLAANAQNAVASIMSGRGVSIGNNNNINQSGRLNGAMTATAIGLGANAQNGVAAIMGGVR